MSARGSSFQAGVRVLVALALLVACGRTVDVTTIVRHPAAVPLRAFPEVVVATGDDLEAIALGDHLVAHLVREGRQRARRVRIAELETMRLGGQLGPASVVVLLELSIRESSTLRHHMRPETVCGPTGCFSRQRPETFDVPLLRARVRLSVHEGPTARALQRLGFGAEEEGRGYDRMRERALAQLKQELIRLVDAREERVRVTLLAVRDDEVERALEHLKSGEWRDGRRLLEAAARSERVSALPPTARARVYYDLAMARRYDPVSLARGDLDRHFRAAESPLREAIRVDPRAVYQEALGQLHRDRVVLDLVRQQEQAATHNFELERQPADPTAVPTPPPGYGP